MNYLSITVFSLGTIFFMSCAGEPDCISQRINQFKLQESTCAGASGVNFAENAEEIEVLFSVK